MLGRWVLGIPRATDRNQTQAGAKPHSGGEPRDRTRGWRHYNQSSLPMNLGAAARGANRNSARRARGKAVSRPETGHVQLLTAAHRRCTTGTRPPSAGRTPGRRPSIHPGHHMDSDEGARPAECLIVPPRWYDPPAINAAPPRRALSHQPTPSRRPSHGTAAGTAAAPVMLKIVFFTAGSR